MNTVSETVTLLGSLVRAIVTDKDGVCVTSATDLGGNVVFTVQVTPRDKGKVIGKQGRTARSLRIILSAIAKEHAQNFSLDVNGDPLQGVALQDGA